MSGLPNKTTTIALLTSAAASLVALESAAAVPATEAAESGQIRPDVTQQLEEVSSQQENQLEKVVLSAPGAYSIRARVNRAIPPGCW
jgi:hypothetical protein